MLLWWSRIPGMKANPIALMAAPKIVSHTTMRHRRDGSRPPGNKSIRNTARVGKANPIHVENQAANSPQGKARVSRKAWSAYAVVKRRVT
jgi:hypothetical protein